MADRLDHLEAALGGMLERNDARVVSGSIPIEGIEIDIVTQDANGLPHGIEIKSGTATPTLYQRFTDLYVNSFGAGGAG